MKIYIIGIVASGKTTLAKRLSKEMNIPWYELDNVVYCNTQNGRLKRTASEQVDVIMEIDKADEWIFEGTDRESYRCLFKMSDTIIFLDTPLWKRKIRILTRFIKQKLRIETCHYTPDLTMLRMMYKWTRDFEENRINFEDYLEEYKQKVIRIKDYKNLKLLKKEILS